MGLIDFNGGEVELKLDLELTQTELPCHPGLKDIWLAGKIILFLKRYIQRVLDT